MYVGDLHVAACSLVLLHSLPVLGLALPLPLSQAPYVTGSTWTAGEVVR